MLQCPYCDHKDYGYSWNSESGSYNISDSAHGIKLLGNIIRILREGEDYTDLFISFAKKYGLSLLSLVNISLALELSNDVVHESVKNPHRFIKITNGKMSADEIWNIVRNQIQLSQSGNNTCPDDADKAVISEWEQKYHGLQADYKRLKEAHKTSLERIESLKTELESLKKYL